MQLKMAKFFNKNTANTTSRVKRLHKVAVTLVVFVLLSAFLVFDNFSLQTEHVIAENEKAFNLGGLRIAHISDYHNRKSELVDSQIFKALRANRPDIIFITGDLIDCSKTDVQKSIEFCTRLCEIAPVYYVTGNHECNFSITNQSDFDNMLLQLEQMGVIVLRQSFVTHQLENGKSVNIYGIDDPYFHCSYSSEITDATHDLCESFTIDKNEMNILLAHHPEQLSVYAEFGFDYVFSGHAHGGQGRLFNQGIIAPDQGFFPKYTGGLYTEENTTMILSRGVGNSIVPVRVFNRPNLIFFEL